MPRDTFTPHSDWRVILIASVPSLSYLASQPPLCPLARGHSHLCSLARVSASEGAEPGTPLPPALVPSDPSFLCPQAALQVGGHGERLTQCREVVLTTSKAIPVQVDGEPCKLAASRIRIALRNQATMVQKAKRRSATPLHSEYVPPCHVPWVPRPDPALSGP